MTHQLKITLALAKQEFDELLTLATVDEIERWEIEEGPRKNRIVGLLEKLNGRISEIDEALSELVSGADAPPVLSLSSDQQKNYYQIAVQCGRMIQRAHLKTGPLEWFADLLVPLEEDANPEPYRRKGFVRALELSYLARLGDEDEFLVDGAAEVVDAEWFQPDQWMHNLSLLRPVLINRQVECLHDLARNRLTEIYRSFTFGLWLASIALCRSLVEYSIKANAGRLRINLVKKNDNGKEEDKGLYDLQVEAAAALPDLSEALKIVRLAGNRILHPKKGNVTSLPPVLRKEALQCVLATKKIVEALYSEFPLK